MSCINYKNFIIYIRGFLKFNIEIVRIFINCIDVDTVKFNQNLRCILLRLIILTGCYCHSVADIIAIILDHYVACGTVLLINLRGR